MSWSRANDARLAELWAQPVTREAIGAEFGVSATTVMYHAHRLGLPHKQPANRPCTKAADAMLAQMWRAGASSRQIAAKIGTNKSVVLDRAKRLGLPSRTRFSNLVKSRSKWSAAMDARLRELWAGPMMRTLIARELGVGLSTMDLRVRKLGLTSRQVRTDWTPEQDATLRDRWATLSIRALAEALGVTVKSIRHRAEVLALPPKPVVQPPRPRKPKAPKPPKAAKQRVVATVFVAPRDERGLHDSPVAAEKIDAKLQRAIEALRRGKDPVGIAHSHNIPLREVYRLRGELRPA